MKSDRICPVRDEHHDLGSAAVVVVNKKETLRSMLYTESVPQTCTNTTSGLRENEALT